MNTRDKPIKTEKQLKAIVRVGQAVNLAVERFVAVGEAMGDDNVEIRTEMYDACKDARAAGMGLSICHCILCPPKLCANKKSLN